MLIFWLVLFIVLVIVELSTFDLTAIWFAIGAAVALVLAAVGVPFWGQIIVFLVVSGVTLYFTRPIAKRYLMPKKFATNADRVIGMTCVVLEDIDNVKGCGSVSVDGKIWTARSVDDQMIAKDTLAQVISIVGIKLMVRPITQEENQTENKGG